LLVLDFYLREAIGTMSKAAAMKKRPAAQSSTEWKVEDQTDWLTNNGWIGEADEYKNDLTCRLCRKAFASTPKFVNHMFYAHRVSKSGLKAHRLAKAQLGMCSIMDVAEATYVRGIQDEPSMWECTVCRKKLGKENSQVHLLRQHHLSKDETKHWWVVQNGHALRNKSKRSASMLNAMILEATLPNREGDQTEDEEEEMPSLVESEVEEEEEVDEEEDEDDKKEEEDEEEEEAREENDYEETGNDETGRASNSIIEAGNVTTIQRLQALIDTFTNARQCEIVTPTLQIAAVAYDWIGHCQQKHRYEYPLEEPNIPTDFWEDDSEGMKDYRDFVAWLKSMKGCSDGTARQHVKQLLRLWDMFDKQEANNFSPMSYAIAIYQSGHLARIMNKPIMDLSYSWSRTILQALTHYVSFAIRVCIREDKPIARNRLEVFKDELGGCMRRVHKQRKVQSRKKKQQHAALLDYMPEYEERNVGVRMAMCTLYLLSLKSPIEQTHKMMHLATICIVGIIFFNGMGGRPMEWKRMLKEYALQRFQDGWDFLECCEHKTHKTHGDLGKHVFPGTMVAIQTYASLFMHRSAYLLDIPDTAYLTRYVHAFLNLFFNMATDEQREKRKQFTITVLRKYFHTKGVRIARENDFIRCISTTDPHGEDVAKSVYVCNTPRDDARLSKLIYLDVMGEPSEWPTQRELDCFRRPVQELLDIKGDPEVLFAEVKDHAEDDDKDHDDVFQAIEDDPNIVTSMPLRNVSDDDSDANGYKYVTPPKTTLTRWTRPCKIASSLLPSPKKAEDDETTARASISSSEGEKKKQRKGYHTITPGEQAWILLQAEPIICKGGLPKKLEYEELLEFGTSTGKLAPETTYDGLRSVIRRKWDPRWQKTAPTCQSSGSKD
jgi:hypothetical protein